MVCLNVYLISLSSLLCYVLTMEIERMLPPSCAMLMHALSNGTESKYTEAQSSVEEIGDLSKFCPNKVQLVVCISENIFEMRSSTDPIVWGLSYLFDIKHTFPKSTMACEMYGKLTDPSAFGCFETTRKGRTHCENSLMENLKYIRKNMPHDGPGILQVQAICNGFIQFVKCQDSVIMGKCPTSIVHMLAFSNTLFGKIECNKPNTTAQVRQTILERSSLTECGLKDMIFQWNGQNDVDFSKLFTAVGRSCHKIDKIDQCLKDKLTYPETHVDYTVKKIINRAVITKSLNIMCASVEHYSSQLTCLEKVSKYGDFCITFVRGAFMTEMFLAHRETLHCSHFKDLVDCLSVQIGKCDPRIADSFQKAYYLELDQDAKCRANRFPSGQLSGSTLIHCGAPLAAAAVNKNQVVLSGKKGLQHLEKIIDVACDEADGYAKCISNGIYSSDNKLDLFMRSIVNLENLNILKNSTGRLCQHRALIKRNLLCMIQKKKALSLCVADFLLTAVQDLNNLSLVATPVASKNFCNHVQHITYCAAEIIGRCDAKLGSLVHSVRQDLVKVKDCGKLPVSSQPSSAIRFLCNFVSVWLCLFIYWISASHCVC